MPTLLDKDRTVDLLATEFAAVTSLLAGLADGQWEVGTCLPGWTVHDVVAHLLGTELQLCGRPPPEADVSHLTHMRNPIATANEAWVESLRPLDPAEMA
ncbi:MAG TPA: maleylpyruvate isomerase family mycothiol-dependent enzyme, partial [Acidimicrobiales bacterium]